VDCLDCAYLYDCTPPDKRAVINVRAAVAIAYSISFCGDVPLCAEHLAWAKEEWGQGDDARGPLSQRPIVAAALLSQPAGKSETP